ncbi:MAG: hypothetical protein RLZZ528_1564, partial [Pseudomonadota bacterium]
MAVTYRTAGNRDAGAIHALLVENAVNDGGMIRGDVDSLTRYGFGLGLFRVILAEEEGRAVGLALVLPEYSSWRGRVGLLVQDLYVIPAMRGRGVGRTLLAEALRACGDWDPAFLTLLVQHKNKAAQAFYS